MEELNNSEKIIRKCCKCQVEKELNQENFYSYKSRLHRGILSYFRKECRVCYNIYMRSNLKKNNAKNKERKKEWDRKYNEKMKNEMTDRYIVRLIKREDKSISIADLKKNKELIELYRLRLILKRQLKND
jgi:hypothetical protein